MLLILFHIAAVQQICFLSGQISESGLIEILEKVSQQTDKKTTVKVSSTEISSFFIHHQPLVHLTFILMLCPFQFNRRKVMDSDDDDDDY